MLGADITLSAIYSNLYTEGFNLFLIGRKSDKKRTEQLLKKLFGSEVEEKVYDIEPLEITRVYYFTISDDEWDQEAPML